MSRNFTFCVCISLDKLALVYVILFFPIPLFWLVLHSGIHFWRRFGNRSLWIALPVWIFPEAAIFLLRRRIFAERLTRTRLTWAVGLPLLVLLFYREIQTRQKFGVRQLVGLPEMDRRRRRGALIREGIYARIRHPRYLGYVLGFGGLLS